jgi:hypothetical protein
MVRPPRASRSTCAGTAVVKAAIIRKTAPIQKSGERKSFVPVARKAASEAYHESSASREIQSALGSRESDLTKASF